LTKPSVPWKSQSKWTNLLVISTPPNMGKLWMGIISGGAISSKLLYTIYRISWRYCPWLRWLSTTQCSCLTRAFIIPGRGGEVGSLTGLFVLGEVRICGWYMMDMLEPSPPSAAGLGAAILSLWCLSQNFIALRT
jgi:hypothetical protein